MTKTASINISQAIACDDIRQEINGKHILIGVYSGNLGVPSFPNVIALGFWVPSQAYSNWGLRCATARARYGRKGSHSRQHAYTYTKSRGHGPCDSVNANSSFKTGRNNPPVSRREWFLENHLFSGDD